MEKRRPEFNGEVSKALFRRIRKLMGGDVELSYPVLGPDEFVISSLREQVHRHGDRKQSGSKEVTAEEVIRAVFESLSLDPATARKLTKISAVARGRALSAWLWVEKLGHSQAVLADVPNLSPEAVTMMLGRLRREGLKRGEKTRLDRVLKTLTDLLSPKVVA